MLISRFTRTKDSRASRPLCSPHRHKHLLDSLRPAAFIVFQVYFLVGLARSLFNLVLLLCHLMLTVHLALGSNFFSRLFCKNQVSAGNDKAGNLARSVACRFCDRSAFGRRGSRRR